MLRPLANRGEEPASGAPVPLSEENRSAEGRSDEGRTCPHHRPDKMCMECAGDHEHPPGCQCYYCVPYR